LDGGRKTEDECKCGLPSFVFRLPERIRVVRTDYYLGGSAEERGLAIAVEATNLVYLTGFTRSSTFPVTLAPQPTFGGGTCGTSSCTDSYITAFDLTANAPVYSTFLGGSNAEEGQAIAVDSSGTAYIAGTTWSTNFPTASPRQGTFGGGTLDAFVAKLIQPTVALGAATANVSENAGNLNLAVTLSAASPVTVTVNYATTTPGTATAGSDYTAQSGTLTFAPNDTSETIGIPILNDLSDEPNETFTVALAGPYGARLGTPASTLVTITNDDAPPTVAWQGANLSVGEGGGSALAPVVLSAPSAFTVTVNYATSNGSATAGSDGLLSPPEKFTTLSPQRTPKVGCSRNAKPLVSLVRKAETSSARGAVALSAFSGPASPGDANHAGCYGLR